MHSILLLRTSMGAVASNSRSVKLSVVNKVVQPHVPSIKFPVRGPGPVLKEVQKPSAGQSSAASDAVLNTAVSSSKDDKVSSKRSTGIVLDSTELPQKYRRKPISKDEMEFIEKGGKV